MADRRKGKPGGGKTGSVEAAPAPAPTPPAPVRKERVRGPALTKAELRAQGALAMATATKAVVKLPTKVVRQCGKCGETSSVMVEPGQPTPPFKCKTCDA